MCDGARDLQREDEAGRCLERPIADGFGRGTTVEGRVHFYRVESPRIIGEVLSGFHALGIKRSAPAVGREGGCPEPNFASHCERYPFVGLRDLAQRAFCAMEIFLRAAADNLLPTFLAPRFAPFSNASIRCSIFASSVISASCRLRSAFSNF